MISVIKRDGSKTNFSKDKIISAISKAMESAKFDSQETILRTSNEIAEWIEKKLTHDGIKEVTVNQLNDMCEDSLMARQKRKSAKNFVIYRYERDKQRESGDTDLQSKYFSPEFLKKYRYAKEPFEPLGAFVKARTYARWIPEKGRRESWFDTVKRAVEFNLSLAKHSQEEAEKLFHNIFYLKQNLSGRMTWLGGTPTAHSNALGLFNCAFDIVDSFDTFVEGFTVLMLGAGLGLRITKEDVAKLPSVRNNIELISKRYSPIDKSKRKEYTSLFENNKNIVEIVIGDSRGAWTEALDIYFKLLWSVKYKEVTTIVLNFDNIREKGSRIKGFGGKSSGYDSLMNMFEKIHETIQKGSGSHYKIKPIDALDIACQIALNVVSGNVRRSSLMILCNQDDNEIINAKQELYTQVNGEWVINDSLIHRQMSNNTVMYYAKPSREQWAWHFNKLRTVGEPALSNMEQALKRNPNAKGLNP